MGFVTSFVKFVTLCFVILITAPTAFGEETWITQTIAVKASYNDAYTLIDTNTTVVSSNYGYVGSGFLTGWRFEDIQVPSGGRILSATLEVFCDGDASQDVAIRYTGEAAEHATPFSALPTDLISRPRTSAVVYDSPAPWIPMSWNPSPDLAPIIEEIVNLGGWRAGNALVLFAEDQGSSGIRGIQMMENNGDHGALLTITYSSLSCEFDTDGDGIVDISAPDLDRDGYCELPIGKTEFPGELIIDRPVEIMGFPATRTETILKGDALRMLDGGTVISDLTSPIVSTAYDGLKGNDLYIIARNRIQIDRNAKILLGGDAEGWWTGDIYFKTLRNGNQIIIDDNARLYGRKIRIYSNGEGSLLLAGGSRLTGRSHIHLQTYEGDIELRHGVSISTSSPDGKCYVRLKASAGDLYLIDNVSIAADVIDFCPIQGDIYDDGTTQLVGKTWCR